MALTHRSAQLHRTWQAQLHGMQMQIFVRQHMLEHRAFLQLRAVLGRQGSQQSIKTFKHWQAIQARLDACLRALHQPHIAIARNSMQQPQLL